MNIVRAIRRVDNFGRVVLPKEFRRPLGINFSDKVEVFMEGESVKLKVISYSCVFCSNDEGIINFKGKMVYKKCIEVICMAIRENRYRCGRYLEVENYPISKVE